MGITVLIVDDGKLARIVAGRAPTALHPDWAEAGDADEALARPGGRDVGVARLGFDMPGRDGLEFAAALRARKPDMPIAADVGGEITARAREIGSAVVPRPATQDGLHPSLSGAAPRLRTPGP